MFCKQCGNQIPDNAAICMKCGVPTGNESAEKDAYAGLNQTGLIVFIILLVVCLPLFWLPWLIDSCKAK